MSPNLGRAMAFACLFASASIFAADGGWSRASVGTHPISVEVTGRVDTKVSSSSWGPFGTAETVQLLATHSAGELVAAASLVPVWALKGAGDDLVFTTTRDTILRKRKGRARSWRSIERAGHAGKRLEYVVVDSSGTEQVGVMEVYVHSPYILTFDTLSTAASKQAGEHFLSSIAMFGNAR
jgi:hypothetical protein